MNPGPSIETKLKRSWNLNDDKHKWHKVKSIWDARVFFKIQLLARFILYMVLLTKGKLYNTELAHENCSYCRNDEDVDHFFLKVPVFLTDLDLEQAFLHTFLCDSSRGSMALPQICLENLAGNQGGPSPLLVAKGICQNP